MIYTDWKQAALTTTGHQSQSCQAKGPGFVVVFGAAMRSVTLRVVSEKPPMIHELVPMRRRRRLALLSVAVF